MANPSLTSRRALLRRAFGAALALPAVGILASCGAATATVSSSATTSSAAVATSAVSSAATSATSAATQASSAASTSVVAATTAAVSSTAASSSVAAAQAATTTTAALSIKPGTAGTLTWMVEFSGPMNEPQYDKFLEPWNQANPNAKVEPVSIGGGDADKYEKILTFAAAGTPLDVIGKVTFIQAMAKPGALQPLEPFISRDKYDISGYNPNTLKTFGSWNGKQYSLPWGLGGNAIAFIYNPNMVAAAGLTPPSQDWKNPFTWDQYREYAQKLTKKQGSTYTVAGAEELGDWDYTIPMQWGAHWVSPDGTKAICNSPEMIQALSSYLDIILKDQTDTASPGVKLSASGNDKRWAAGQTAMSFIGGWEMNTFTDPSNYKNDYVIATFPKGTAASPDQDTIQLAVGANIKDPASAWNFVKWLLQGGRYANLVSRMPVLTSDAIAWSKTAFAKVPATAGVDVLTSSLAIAAGPDPVRAIPGNSQFEKSIATPLWDNLLAQKVTVQDGLAQAQSQLQTLLDQTTK
jgi:multiple sugar transport system substrate-binding protein